MAGDIHFDKVCFLLNGEGADNTIPLFERSKYKRKLSCGTATRIGKTNPVNSSNHISLTNNSTNLMAYNVLSEDLGYNDFTIEFWIRPYSASSNDWGAIFQLGTTDYGVNGILSLVRESNSVPMSLRLDYYDGQWEGQFTNTTLTDEAWNHIAVVRNNNVLSLYLNGIKTYERIGGNGSYLRGRNLSLGRRLDSTSGIKADYASVRITEGVCRYTTNFTPSTEDHPDYGYIISGKLNGVDSSEEENVAIRVYRRSSGEFLNEVKSFNSPQVDPLFDDVSLLLDISAKKVIDSSKYNTSIIASKQLIILEGQGPGGTNAINMDGLRYLHFPDLQMLFGKGDFTVEAHLYFNSLTSDQTFFDTRPSGGNGNYINVGVNSTDITYYTQSTVRISAAHNIVLNDWNHIAVCKKDGYVRLFVNGVQKGPTITETFSQELGDLGFILGANGFNRSLFLLNAKISSLRVTRAARYDSNFAVPSNIFPKSKGYVGVAGEYSIKVSSSEEVQVVAISPDSNEVYNDILYRVDNQ